jgi:hypothetical protein
MQTNIDKKVLDRVRKLLALSRDGGATEGEAANAAEIARRIMAENGISNATIEASGGEGEARKKDGRKGHTGKRWMRDIMRALAEQAFVVVEWSEGRRAYDFEEGKRKAIPGQWNLFGRESAVVTVKLMHEYLVRTVDRIARERGTPTDEVFKEAMGMRIAERVAERHEQAMRVQAREAREKQAAQAHPSNAGDTSVPVVILEDYATKEQELNNDLRMGWAPGTTEQKRLVREAEDAERQRRRNEELAERQHQRETWINEGIDEEVVEYMMDGFSRERAEALVAESHTPEAAAKRRREQERSAKENEKYHERYRAQQERAHAKYTSASYREGRRAGETVGLDAQVDQRETRKLS